MPYTWMGNEHAAAASIVTAAIPQILAWYEKRKGEDSTICTHPDCGAADKTTCAKLGHVFDR